MNRVEGEGGEGERESGRRSHMKDLSFLLKTDY